MSNIQCLDRIHQEFWLGNTNKLTLTANLKKNIEIQMQTNLLPLWAKIGYLFEVLTFSFIIVCALYVIANGQISNPFRTLNWTTVLVGGFGTALILWIARQIFRLIKQYKIEAWKPKSIEDASLLLETEAQKLTGNIIKLSIKNNQKIIYYIVETPEKTYSEGQFHLDQIQFDITVGEQVAVLYYNSKLHVLL